MRRIVSTVGCCFIWALLIVAVGCGRNPSASSNNAKAGSNAPAGPGEVVTGPVTFPELGPSRIIQPGIRFKEATIQRAGVPMKVWVYLPQKAGTAKLPLVLVPPAGSTLLAGMDLGDGDRAEHYPYARAGFAVVSFEIDGPVAPTAPDSAVIRAAQAFKASQAGLANAKTALDFALAKVPNLNAKRVYTAGHSSAATLALLFACHEPRIKACAAFAPVTDVEERLRPAVPALGRYIPGLEEFIRFSSPRTHIEKLKCPVFLFHAQDDSNVPYSQSSRFAEQLKRTNANVTFVSARRGGHYESMIREGVPKAIEWMKTLQQ